MANIEQKSVICKTCNMPHTLDANGECEFCRRVAGDPLLTRRDVRQGEAQVLLAVLMLLVIIAVITYFGGLTGFLIASNIYWFTAAIHFCWQKQKAEALNKRAEIAVGMAQAAVDKCQSTIESNEWPSELDGKEV